MNRSPKIKIGWSRWAGPPTFRGISILIIGDFIQLPVSTGHDLWSVMYVNVSGKDGTARDLFQHFFVLRSQQSICNHLNVKHICSK